MGESTKPDAARSSSSSSVARYPRGKLLALTAGFLGIQLCWAVQVGYVTKVLLQLGMAERFVSYAWLAGPIAGIVVQPTVGVYSDRCTSRLGRRRPFLLVGSVITVVCLLTFSFSSEIGAWLGDGASDASRPRALVVAVASFWALDFALNGAQGPFRALLADIVPPEQHKEGNAYFALMSGLGNFLGNLLGSMRMSRLVPVFREDTQALYFTAAVFLIASMATTLISTKETPLHHVQPPRAATGYAALESSPRGASELQMLAGEGAEPNSTNFWQAFSNAATKAPYPFYELFAIQCFTWFAWFSMFVFATSWVGAEVFNGVYDAPVGSAERELYNAGVRAGNLGLSMQSVVTIAFSAVLPTILARVSTHTVYFFAHVVHGTALLSTLLLHHRSQAWLAAALLALTGVSWAATMAIPWALMGEAVSKHAPESAGILFTIFNASQCFPEIVVSLGAEEIERLTGRQSAVLAFGGVTALTGGALIVALRIGVANVEHRERDDSSPSLLQGAVPVSP